MKYGCQVVRVPGRSWGFREFLKSVWPCLRIYTKSIRNSFCTYCAPSFKYTNTNFDFFIGSNQNFFNTNIFVLNSMDYTNWLQFEYWEYTKKLGEFLLFRGYKYINVFLFEFIEKLEFLRKQFFDNQNNIEIFFQCYIFLIF